MYGESHVSVGMAATMTMASVGILSDKPEAILMAVGASVLGSLLPDIDEDGTTINHLVNKVLKQTRTLYAGIGLWLMYYMYSRATLEYVGLAVVLLIIGLGKHRGATHSLWAVLLLLTIDGIPHSAKVGLIVGYVLHLAFDGSKGFL